MEPWAGYLRALAAMPNTWCKISGLVNEADWEHWTTRDVQPYIEKVIETFGFDRILFGGDWPVCTLATDYQRWVTTLLRVLSTCLDEERRKLFYDNAVSFYRL